MGCLVNDLYGLTSFPGGLNSMDELGPILFGTDERAYKQREIFLHALYMYKAGEWNGMLRDKDEDVPALFSLV